MEKMAHAEREALHATGQWFLDAALRRSSTLAFGTDGAKPAGGFIRAPAVAAPAPEQCHGLLHPVCAHMGFVLY